MGTCNKKIFVTRFLGVLGIALLLLGSGCNPVAHIGEFDKNELAKFKPMYGPSADSLYRLVPHDTVSVRFPYHPEQDPKSSIAIRPDGNIALEGIGEIQAVGLSPDQLAKIIAEKSSVRLKNPEVVVTVSQYAQRKIFVGGEVKSPGVVTVQDNLTPLQAIFERGGFTVNAQTDSVILIRDAGSPNPIIGRLNLHQAMEGGLPELVALIPSDVLYVPMTGIGRADLWVRQYIRELIPREYLAPPSLGSLLGY